MPLTPADVHNVAFSKPPIGKRGYNEDEVDAFLDLVENELSRLIEENADLRQRVSELDSELASAQAADRSPRKPPRSTRHRSPNQSPSPSRPRRRSTRRLPRQRRRLPRARSRRCVRRGCWRWPRTPRID
jgi:DivIVA domain-containing protein